MRAYSAKIKFKVSTPVVTSRTVVEQTFARAAQKAGKHTAQIIITSLVIILLILPTLRAFEAHIVNVVATPVLIDPPTLDPPGGNDITNFMGGQDLTGEVSVDMSDSDPDATKIFFNFGPGSDQAAVDAVTNPNCSGPFGGDKTAPQSTSFSSDTTVKALACDNLGHASSINTKIYTFAPVEAGLIGPLAAPQQLILDDTTPPPAYNPPADIPPVDTPPTDVITPTQ